MESVYKIYKYTFPSGMIYIGMTKNSISKRKDQGYNHNKRLKTAIREVGFKNIKAEIIEDNLTQEEAYEREIYYIKYYNSADEHYGYNQSKGGKNGFLGLHHTEEHKKYMSEKYKGIKFTDEHIINLRLSHKSQSKPVICETKGGEIIKYNSMNDAAKDVGGYISNISRACASGKYYKERKWTFTEGSDEK